MIIDHHFISPATDDEGFADSRISQSPVPPDSVLEAIRDRWPSWRIMRTVTGGWWAWKSDAIQVEAGDPHTLERKLHQWCTEDAKRTDAESRAQLVRPYVLPEHERFTAHPQIAPPAEEHPLVPGVNTTPRSHAGARASVVSTAGGAHHTPIGRDRQADPNRASA